MVGMWEAYKLLFTNYINFGGKSSRAEYWWVQLINFIISIVVLFLFAVLFGIMMSGKGIIFGIILGVIIFSIYGLVILIPSIALIFRRYRDAGVSPWWLIVTALLPYILTIVSKEAGILYYIAIILSLISLVITILPSKK